MNRGNVILVTIITIVLLSSLSIILLNNFINSSTVDRDYGTSASHYYKVETVKEVFKYAYENVLSNKVLDVHFNSVDGYFVDGSTKVIDDRDLVDIKTIILNELDDSSVDVYIEFKDKYVGSFCTAESSTFSCDPSLGNMEGMLIIRDGNVERRVEFLVTGLSAEINGSGNFRFDLGNVNYEF